MEGDLCDWFLHVGKYRPALYLDPVVRSGISSFACPGFEDEVVGGLQQLQADIATRRIGEVIQSYENDKGDYLFIEAVKE